MKEEIKKEYLKDGILNIEITERTGKAQDLLPEREPQQLKLQGTIDSPANFYHYREPDINNRESHVNFSYENKCIELVINEQSHIPTIVIGKIKVAPDCTALKINSGSCFMPRDLASLLRRKMYLFVNRESAITVITALNNLKAKVDKEINQGDDKRGNIKRSFDQIVTSNIPASFQLLMPIFEGFAKELLTISIEISEDLNCSLWSDEMFVLENELVKTAIDAELSKLNSFVQIHV